jgi:transcriptional regulator with XRE-family HTH domain
MARRAEIDPKEYEGIIRRLREAREKAGLTQEELADVLGADRGIINKIEMNRRRLDAQELKLLCERLGVSADFILGIRARAKR